MNKKEFLDILLAEKIMCKTELFYLSKTLIFKKVSCLLCNEQIKIKSNTLNKNKLISSKELLILNLDIFVLFFKEHFLINTPEINYVLELVLANNYAFLLDKRYYFDNNQKYYINNFKKIVCDKFLTNYDILKNKLDTKININSDLFKTIKMIINSKRRNIYHLFVDINDENFEFCVTMWNHILSVYLKRKKHLKSLGI